LKSSNRTHFVQLTKPSQVLVRPTGIQAVPSPVNSTIITVAMYLNILKEQSRISVTDEITAACRRYNM